MAAVGMSPICYNHPEKRADFKCFDCKYESIINLCAQCNIQVHSLDVFRAHRVEQLELKGRERRLSQDVSDIEKLIEVENDLLQNVMTKLKFTEQEEKETLSQLIHLQTAAKKRIAEIKDCEAKIEKAVNYLAKVSSMLTQCISPVGDSENETVKDPSVVSIETTRAVEQPSGPVLDSTDQPCVRPSQEPLGEDQKGPPAEQPIIYLPDEMKGKDVFPVCVVGSLARNGSFWIVRIGEPEVEKQRLIQAAIRNYFYKHGFGDPVVVKEGTLCTMLHRQFKEFCRARIEQVTNSGMVRLRFLDLGTVEEVSPSSLCQLPVDVVDVSFQALESCLLPDLETQLPYEAKWCFKDLTFKKVLMAAVEGQVTDKKGHVVHHVTLGSCGEIPVCINSKVTKLVEDQKVGLEDRPLQPKVEPVEAVGGEDTCKQQTWETATPGNFAKVDTKKSASQEEETSAKTDTEISVTNEIVSRDDKIVVSAKENDNASVDKPVLRAEAAEFVPVSPESDLVLKKIPRHLAVEQNSVPGILHLPAQDSAVSTMPAPALKRFNNTVPDTKLPVGCVDFATYNHILTKCSLNLICKEDLPTARFMLIKSDGRRIVEAMKFNVWCSNAYGNKKLNQAFSEAANKGRSPVFLLFSETRSSGFCGMAEMISAVDPTKSCPMLNEPFRFGSKMIGRCDIKWVYASNLYFADVITPTCGFSRRYLEDAIDSFEIANTLGQMIVQAFDSSGKFQSILQQAMKKHQCYLTGQQENRDRDSYRYVAEPLWNTLEEDNNGLPASQEDWDQEIEENLRAAKSSDFNQVTVNSVEEAPKDIPFEIEETDFAVISEVDAHVSVEGASLPADTSPVTGDGDIVTVSDVEEVVIEVVDTHHQDGTVAIPEQHYDHQKKGLDEDQGISSPVSSVGSQSTAEVSVLSSQEMEAEGSAPKERQEDVHEHHSIEPTEHNQNGSLDAAVETVYGVSNASEIKLNLYQDLNEAMPHTCNSSGVEANEDDPGVGGEPPLNADDSKAVANNTEHNQNGCRDLAEETVHSVSIVENEVVPHTCNSSEVEANEDDPGGWGDSPLDSCQADKVCEDSKVVVSDLGESSISEGQVNGVVGAKHDPILTDLCSDEVLSHGSSEEVLSDYDDLPVEIGKEHWIVPSESVSSSGTFWACVVRTSKEEVCFVDAMKRMGDHIEAKNKALDPSEIHIYKQCAVKGWDGYWYRALVEKILDKGKIYIRLLDLGESWEIHLKELRVLDDEFYASPPAQAFECSVCYENPNSRKEKSRVSKLVKKNKKLRVLVKNYSREGLVGVQVLP